ncbi:MAG: hypothetical protein VX324_08375 [Pseudomonadota bacterium]|jgi:hypothetical protein|uniref:hypothetical protein n=1 Tax=Marinobacter sp. TaxID=50741 RepID=UPI002E8609E5|nr:hypothetical protein [Pseudomonadota bacterium]
MKHYRYGRALTLVGALTLASTIPATVLASDDLDVTMRMVTDDAELSESVVRELELPRLDSSPAVGGNADADSRGLDTAEQARERGRAFGQEMSERARESRDLTQGVPGRPEAPDRPQRPELPETPGRDR